MIVSIVFLPMLAALAVPLVKKWDETQKRDVFGFFFAVIFLCSLILCFFPSEEALPLFVSLGARFSSASFRGVLGCIASFMWLSTALASPAYFAHAEKTARYYAFYLFTLGAILGVFYAADFFTLFLFFEMMSIASYVWVVQNETKDAIRAAETYLYIAVIGGLVLLMGLFLIYARGEELSAAAQFAAAVCMLVGFGAKAGMFPLHIWLPKAHPVAPAPASALLSGILTKSGVFGVILVTCTLMEGVENWGRLLLLLATVTMVLGAVLAVCSVDLKRTLACSSMSQIGFILVGVAMRNLLGEEGSLASYGTVLHMMNHSLIKLTLFVAAGVIYCNMHTLDLNRLRGFGKDKPLLKYTFLAGACSIAGIPGFSGYVSKTLLHESIVEYGLEVSAHGGSALPYTVVEWLFLISGGLTFAYMSRLFYILFMAKPAEGQHTRSPYVDKPTAAVLCVGGGLMPLLGLTAHKSMERIALYAAEVFGTEAPEHTVHYFAFANLKGAFISIAVGVAVLYFIGFRRLTKKDENKEEHYENIWPEKLDLEDAAYRPALRGLAFLGAVIARALASAGTWLIYSVVNLLFYKADEQVKPAEDKHFGRYGKKKERYIADESFSADLLLAAIGIAVLLLFLLLHL